MIKQSKKRTPWNYYIAPRLTDTEHVAMARHQRVNAIKLTLQIKGVL